MSKIIITVNGVDHEIDSPNMLLHEDVAKLGYGDDIMDKPHAQYLTCVYSAKIPDIPNGRLEGTLYNGGPGVQPIAGMRFTIMSTGNA
jgi:hypothetical protein